MPKSDLEKAVQVILTFDKRYDVHAYLFTCQALTYTTAELHRENKKGQDRHVSGLELLNGMLDYAVERYGFLAQDVFEYWKIQDGRDVGAIVYNLIRVRQLCADSHDKIEDFDCMFNLPGQLRSRIKKCDASQE